MCNIFCFSSLTNLQDQTPHLSQAHHMTWITSETYLVNEILCYHDCCHYSYYHYCYY